MDGAVGLGGYHPNIHLVYPLVHLTGHPILCGWCCQIRQIASEYSFSAGNGQPDRPSDMMWMVLLNRADTIWIFIWCNHWSAWQAIEYYVNDAVGSGGYTPNINWVYPSVSRTAHPILSGRYRQIRRIHTKYSLAVSIGQADRPSNIIWEVPSDQADTH